MALFIVEIYSSVIADRGRVIWDCRWGVYSSFRSKYELILSLFLGATSGRAWIVVRGVGGQLGELMLILHDVFLFKTHSNFGPTNHD